MSLFSWFQNAWQGAKQVFSGKDSPTGDLFRVENKGKYKTANRFYFAARLRDEGDPDSAANFLFTESDLDKAQDRAWKNAEDLPWDEEGNRKAQSE